CGARRHRGIDHIDRAALRRSPYPSQQPQMGYRRCPDAVAATRARPSDGSPFCLPYGRRLVRDADELCQGCRDVHWSGGAAVKRVVMLNGEVAAVMSEVPLPYKLHILLGFTVFLISPFTRMIHIWSGAGTLAYLFRPYQIVRTPQTRAKEPIRS